MGCLSSASQADQDSAFRDRKIGWLVTLLLKKPVRMTVISSAELQKLTESELRDSVGRTSIPRYEPETPPGW
jgi:hypothetical protein